MEQTFEDILSSLLDGYEKNESKDIAVFVKGENRTILSL